VKSRDATLPGGFAAVSNLLTMGLKGLVQSKLFIFNRMQITQSTRGAGIAFECRESLHNPPIESGRQTILPMTGK